MMTIEDCREFYAREVKFAASLTTPELVEAFAKVPREKFLGPGPWQIGSAEGRAGANVVRHGGRSAGRVS
jgi:protein-L-isoaspartate(D-aspartate) O-methyltransferase